MKNKQRGEPRPRCRPVRESGKHVPMARLRQPQFERIVQTNSILTTEFGCKSITLPIAPLAMGAGTIYFCGDEISSFWPNKIKYAGDFLWRDALPAQVAGCGPAG